MAADLSETLAGGAASSEVTTVPNEVFSVQATTDVRVETKNVQADPDEWETLGFVRTSDGARSFVATGETIRIVCLGTDSSDVEVYL